MCALLLVDFLVRLRAAESKLAFMRWGWIDLLAAVPAVDALRFGRLLRIVRIVRMIVAVRSFQRFLRILWSSKAHAGAAAVFVVAFLVVSFGSVGILLAEQGADGNIRTAEDALWWTMTTVTTVGYGDRYPVTNLGRAIAGVVMISGIGLFGTLSGVAASLFVGGDKDEPASREAQHAMLAQLEELRAELALARETRSTLAKRGNPPTLDG